MPNSGTRYLSDWLIFATSAILAPSHLMPLAVPPPSQDNQKHLQTLTDVPCGVKLPLAESWGLQQGLLKETGTHQVSDLMNPGQRVRASPLLQRLTLLVQRPYSGLRCPECTSS